MNQYAALGARPAQVLCDLRSDTVTVPCAAMRAAMAEAEVGDDVYGDDPTAARLERTLAERLDKEAGLFVASGTQSNLLALLVHCARGEEVLTGRGYHIYTYEAMGASVLGGIAIDPLTVAEDGALAPEEVTAAVKPDDAHMPITRLLSLENTHNGRVVPLARLEALASTARAAGLAMHLDGARYFNAAQVLGAGDAAQAALFDTVSVCLSKGLGAPVGSVLLGPLDVIDRARRWRKMLGGGMRQVGVLAAAGLFALEHCIDRLGEDHSRAEALAATLAPFGAVQQATNMVFFTPEVRSGDDLSSHMAAHGVRLGGTRGTMRLVLHRDVDDSALAAAQAGFTSYFA